MIRYLVGVSLVLVSVPFACLPAAAQDVGRSPPSAERETPERRPAVRGQDEDSGNARDPALPSSEQGKGQETGGPARERIPQ